MRILPLSFVLVLVACGNRPTVEGDSGGVSIDCSEGMAIFQSASGGDTDVTDELSGGSSGSPTNWSTSDDGTLTFCGGEWTVHMEFESTDLTIVGSADFDTPVLKGGGVSNQISLLGTGATVLLENLEFTNGYKCWGSVVRAVNAGDLYVDGELIAEGCDYVYEPVSVDLTLRDVLIYDNDFPEELGGGMLGVTESLVTLYDTLIYSNHGHGIVALNSDVVCNGSSAVAAGIQDHTKNGVWMMGDDLAEKSSYSTVSNGCDWGGNGYDDVLIGEVGGGGAYSDFGNDADFVCESSSMLCE